jgi:hypothetical protein
MFLTCQCTQEAQEKLKEKLNRKDSDFLEEMKRILLLPSPTKSALQGGHNPAAPLTRSLSHAYR